MKYKKIIISIITILAIAAAIYSILNWQKMVNNTPVRQTEEIR
ncbi:MAG: hypothetical protein NTW50_01800 [Candidatus Berkelbacteria bacterium]|nr:hypothetical protein [Candidatus Berkelbacteria bacterium]